ncbi:hypothetical protein PC117_g22093 [Phytophthora cactorum]|uniref:Histidine phosphatase superfamily n=1 Tax=Phytophthora cactorum TaxID=29920 RepID=A0A8T1BC89_9STRA|nr:hypothetical protein PC117_g22093 [Phytophthora cactorum]
MVPQADESSEPLQLFRQFKLATSTWLEFREKLEAATNDGSRNLKVVLFIRHGEGLHNEAIRLPHTVWYPRREEQMTTKHQGGDGTRCPINLTELRMKFPAVDFSALVDEEDVLWTTDHRESAEEIQTRAKEFLTELFRTIPERHVAVVTHFGFIEALCAATLGMKVKAGKCEVVPLVLEQLA